MRTITAALTGTLALTAAAGLLLSDHLSRKKTRSSTAPDDPDSAPQSAARNPSPKSDDTRLTALLREGTPMAHMEMVSLYSALAKMPDRADDRRTIVHEIVRRSPEPLVAVSLLSMAVTGDATPLDADQMLGEVAQAMIPLWKDDAMFAVGRDMMRLAETDKTRALLAASLTARATKPAAGQLPIGGSQWHELASDLIQVNMHTQDRALKAQTLENVRTIAGNDVAEVLADPTNAHLSMAARREEQAETEAAARLQAGQMP